MKARKKMETTNMNLTGKASIDKPWLKYYPEELHNMETPKITLEEFLKMKNPDDSKIAFEYYGNKITWKTLWEEVDKAAKSWESSSNVLTKHTGTLYHLTCCRENRNSYYL